MLECVVSIGNDEPSALSESLHLSVAGELRSAGCVYADEEARLLISSVPKALLHEKVAQRASGVPLEYVLGWAEFHGHRVALEPGVFIPRRRTEFLVSRAAQLLSPGDVLLDLCCGSGAVALAVASCFASAAPLVVWGCDIDPLAVRCAQENLAPVRGSAVQGDLFDALPVALQGQVNVIVANAPYVPSRETALLPRESRLYEPRRTVDGGPDGLAVQRRLLRQAPVWLAPGGSLLIETSQAAAAGTQSIVEACGLKARTERSDEWDATVVVGTLTPRA